VAVRTPAQPVFAKDYKYSLKSHDRNQNPLKSEGCIGLQQGFVRLLLHQGVLHAAGLHATLIEKVEFVYCSEV
jgi:hypothetical protein